MATFKLLSELQNYLLTIKLCFNSCNNKFLKAEVIVKSILLLLKTIYVHFFNSLAKLLREEEKKAAEDLKAVTVG